LLLARRLHRYFHVLAQRSKKTHKFADRETAGSVSSKRRNMRLRNAQDFPSLRLREITLLDNATLPKAGRVDHPKNLNYEFNVTACVDSIEREI
jgi:hypothetical protein